MATNKAPTFSKKGASRRAQARAPLQEVLKPAAPPRWLRSTATRFYSPLVDSASVAAHNSRPNLRFPYLHRFNRSYFTNCKLKSGVKIATSQGGGEFKLGISMVKMQKRVSRLATLQTSCADFLSYFIF